jgi:repressor of nif and glnA expression
MARGFLNPFPLQSDTTMGFETQDIERKTISILKVLSDSKTPLGSRVIARRLKNSGIELGERAVRYHLKLMDERRLTQLVGRRDGRVLTELGIEEIENALVKDKVGLAISRIELLAFRTDFDLDKHTGSVPINVSLFPKLLFGKALKLMKPAFATGLCVSNLVAVAQEGEMLGESLIPQDMVGLATICSVVINGALLKAGVPMDSKFSGILQFRNHKPLRFVELIHYSGCSLDPSDVFIKAKMTSISKVVSRGEGRILATYREIPALCQPIVEKTLNKLREAGVGGVLTMGGVSEAVCEIPVELNRIGIVLLNGLNPVAAAVEAGIEIQNQGMSTVIEYKKLIDIQELG